MTHSGNATIARSAALALLLAARLAAADDVPPALQADLLSKATGYIRNLPLPASGPTRVVVVYAGSATAVSRDAQTMISKLQAQGFLAIPAAFRSAAELKATFEIQKPTIVYLTPDLDEKAVLGTLEACGSQQYLTTTGVASHVSVGVILGFTLVEGKPKILVNLERARTQKLDLSSRLLSLAVIVK